MLGMFVQAIRSFQRPYAARRWTLDDWNHYLSGLHSLGYDEVLCSTQLDSMPHHPTESDQAFLAMIGQVIDLAHQRYGMKFMVGGGANTIGNDKAAATTFELREDVECSGLVDPRDPAAVAAFLEARRRMLTPLRDADAFVMIDSDGGGYRGTTDEDFVTLMAAQLQIFRELNPRVEMICWMWNGWENWSRHMEAEAAASPGAPVPPAEWNNREHDKILALMQERIEEPWSLYACWGMHQESAERLAMRDKLKYYPFNLLGDIDGSSPLTRYAPRAMAEGFAAYSPAQYPRGVMGNVWSPPLSLPHTYLFAHFARGGTEATVDLERFAEDVVPGVGAAVARAWQAIGDDDPATQRMHAAVMRREADTPRRAGTSSGLLFGDARRFLEDLAANLEIHAALADLAAANSAGRELTPALRVLLQHLRSFHQRLGDVGVVGWSSYEALEAAVKTIGIPFGDSDIPAIQAILQLYPCSYFYPTKLIEHLEEYCRS